MQLANTKIWKKLHCFNKASHNSVEVSKKNKTINQHLITKANNTPFQKRSDNARLGNDESGGVFSMSSRLTTFPRLALPGVVFELLRIMLFIAVKSCKKIAADEKENNLTKKDFVDTYGMRRFAKRILQRSARRQSQMRTS